MYPKVKNKQFLIFFSIQNAFDLKNLISVTRLAVPIMTENLINYDLIYFLIATEEKSSFC